VSDIAYIATKTGWVHLAVIITFIQGVIGWQLSDHMKGELVCQAIKKARCHRGC